MKARNAIFKIFAAIGAIIGYGSLIGFLYLVGAQAYRWFREGEWTHIGLDHGLRTALAHCCVKDGDGGRFAIFLRWLETPTDWLGVHKVFEAVPASLALFALSIVGNCLFIYCRDRLDK